MNTTRPGLFDDISEGLHKVLSQERDSICKDLRAQVAGIAAAATKELLRGNMDAARRAGLIDGTNIGPLVSEIVAVAFLAQAEGLSAKSRVGNSLRKLFRNHHQSFDEHNRRPALQDR